MVFLCFSVSFLRKQESDRLKGMSRDYYVYILASKNNNVLYIGVTNNLKRRAYEHRLGLIEGFTKKYHVHKLIYFEQTNDIKSAIEREKRMKAWKRDWKVELIEKENKNWEDLYDKI